MRCLNGSSSSFGSPKKDLVYVGQSQGSYDKVQQYSYVGDGQGTFSKEVVTTHYTSMCRKLCIGMLAASGLAFACLAIAYMVLASSHSPRTDVSRSHGIDVNAKYNCRNVTNNLERAWSSTKRDWCCANAGSGCTAPTTSAMFDCQAGFANWANGWTDAKKHWCCTDKKLVCARSNVTTTEKPTSQGKDTMIAQTSGCDTECVYRSQTATCKERISWAANRQFIRTPHPCATAHSDTLRKCPACKEVCSLAGAGCVLTTAPPVSKATTSSPYDCTAGFENWKQGWSLKKKDWCCENMKRGCPPLIVP